MKSSVCLLLLLAATVPGLGASGYKLHSFKKVQLSEHFWCEGADIGDFDRDGHRDVAAGPFWWAGPDFQARHEFRPADKTSAIKGADGKETTIPGWKGALGKENDYSDNFFTFVYDLNGDGWDDIIVIDTPGVKLFWYENPKRKSGDGHWPKHFAFDVVDNESPTITDLVGDGKPELVCNYAGTFGYATPDWANPTAPWKWHAITPDRKYHKYTHGLGVGDVNGDGRKDLLEANGWWEQPASLAGDPVWSLHEFPFAPNTGAAQIDVYDFNGDGRNDVLCALSPHLFGLAWYEQMRTDGQITFRQHIIMNRQPAENRYGVKFSQPHAQTLVDMDGDGVKDFVVGKRFWAHGPTGDEEPNAPAVLYWFRTVRGPGGAVDFVPHLIDDNSGVGTQVEAKDLNGDRLPDVIVGNKKGVFVFLHSVKEVDRETWEKAQPKPLSR